MIKARNWLQSLRPSELTRRPSLLRQLPPILVLATLHLPCLAAHAERCTIRSPRLQSLRAAVEAGNVTQVAAFWTEMQERGTPLVEAIEGVEPSDSPHDVWLTFLWRGNAATKTVALAGGGLPGRPHDWRLTLLAQTDVWYLTVRMRSDLRANYFLLVDDPLEDDDNSDDEATKERATRLKRDPLNPHKNMSGSLVELAQAPPQPWTVVRPGVPKGSVQFLRFHSELLNNDRPVTVYRPRDYESAGKPYPLLIVFDQEAYTLLVPTPTILNNLIHEKNIPPTVAVLVGNAKDARDKELPCNETFVRFLAEELLPKIRADHHVTSDPSRVIVAGSSYGGLAAAFFAFKHPELVGNVLSQSGSYWWAPGLKYGRKNSAVEGEWLTRQYVHAPAKAIRFFLEAGLGEATRIENRHFRDVLQAKGYAIAGFSEYNGGHDYSNWRGSFADGLISLSKPREDGNRGASEAASPIDLQ